MAEKPRVAIYSLCEGGDKSTLLLARSICKQNRWFQPLEYVDTSKAQAYEWKNLMADIAIGDYIQVLVTYHGSPELERYCQQYDCTLVQART